MIVSSSALAPPIRRLRLVAACLVLLLGAGCLGLHPLLHHADDPIDQTCAVCVQLNANPAAPTAVTELPADRSVAVVPVAAPPRVFVPFVATTNPRAPPPAFPVS